MGIHRLVSPLGAVTLLPHVVVDFDGLFIAYAITTCDWDFGVSHHQHQERQGLAFSSDGVYMPTCSKHPTAQKTNRTPGKFSTQDLAEPQKRCANAIGRSATPQK